MLVSAPRLFRLVRGRGEHDIIIPGDLDEIRASGGHLDQQRGQRGIARGFDHGAFGAGLDQGHIGMGGQEAVRQPGDHHFQPQRIGADIGDGGLDRFGVGRLGAVFQSERGGPFPVAEAVARALQFGGVTAEIPAIPRAWRRKAA